MVDYSELSRRLNYIKDLYQQYNIQIKPGQGLSDILLEAEKIANGDKIPEDDDKIKSTVEAFHYTWALAETLETCVNGGWDVSNHLKQITTGTVNYGEPAPGNEFKKIFFKDFECELFIGSSLIKQGLKPELLENPDDPKGDLEIDSLFIEVKHPNSTGQITKLMRKFNKEMRDNNSYGVFVVGVEDMFNMGDRYHFDNKEHFRKWNTRKRQEIEQFGLQKTIPMAQKLPRLLGLVQTSTKIYDIAGATDLKRLSNSMILIRNGIPANYLRNAKEIVDVFNPDPPMIEC